MAILPVKSWTLEGAGCHYTVGSNGVKVLCLLSADRPVFTAVDAALAVA